MTARKSKKATTASVAATTAAPSAAPTTAVKLVQGEARDYVSDREVIRCQDGSRFILRTVERDALGVSHFVLYTAWEPAGEMQYHVLETAPGGKVWGRVDTMAWNGRPVRLFDRHWTSDHGAPIYWAMLKQAEAHKLIVATCPETTEGYTRPDGISLAFVRALDVNQAALDEHEAMRARVAQGLEAAGLLEPENIQ